MEWDGVQSVECEESGVLSGECSVYVGCEVDIVEREVSSVNWIVQYRVWSVKRRV